MKIAYGIDISDENDPFIKIGERGVEVISDTTSAGAFLVDIVPACTFQQPLSIFQLINENSEK